MARLSEKRHISSPCIFMGKMISKQLAVQLNVFDRGSLTVQEAGRKGGLWVLRQIFVLYFS